jgi:predicted Zn-dependent protease
LGLLWQAPEHETRWRIGLASRGEPDLKLRVFALVVLLTLTGCEKTPTGRDQLALIPDQVMAEMGARAFARMKQDQPTVSDTARQAQLECVARRVLGEVESVYPGARMPDDREVVIFDNPAPNAFALPGGRIGIHTGMFRVAEGPDQLAAIIGHEVGHLLADHGNERLTQKLGLRIALMLIGLFGEVENEQVLQALGLGARLGVTLPFSRAHEREADEMGQQLMAAAGFRPAESVALWQNMAQAASGQPLEFLSTHPAHDTRIEHLRERLPGARRRYEQAEPARCPPA